jgi:hypothetical protein
MKWRLVPLVMRLLWLTLQPHLFQPILGLVLVSVRSFLIQLHCQLVLEMKWPLALLVMLSQWPTLQRHLFQFTLGVVLVLVLNTPTLQHSPAATGEM